MQTTNVRNAKILTWAKNIKTREGAIALIQDLTETAKVDLASTYRPYY